MKNIRTLISKIKAKYHKYDRNHWSEELHIDESKHRRHMIISSRSKYDPKYE